MQRDKLPAIPPQYLTDSPAARRRLAALREHFGDDVNIAAVCGITNQAVGHWRDVPVRFVLRLEAASGRVLSRHFLAPAYYPPTEAAT